MSTEWRFFRNVFPNNREKACAGDDSPARWQLFVFDAKSPSILSQVPESPHISKFSRNHWRTLWSDGNTVQTFDDTLVCLSDRIYRLRNDAITKTKAHRCREGNLCCRYRFEILTAQPVTGGKSNVLWRSAEQRFLDFCNCDSIQEGDVRLKRIEAEETSCFSIHSICGDTISIDSLTDEYDIGAVEPHGGRVWHTLRITDHGLKKSRIAKPLLQRADRLYCQMTETDATAQDYDPNYFETRGYLLSPHKGGVAVEFQCDSRLDPCDPTLYCLRLEEPGGLDSTQKLQTQAFVALHPTLVDWDKLDVFTIAPDGESVLYLRDRQLSWHTTSGKTVEFGPASDLRGWQWVDSTRLHRNEKIWLNATKQVAAS